MNRHARLYLAALLAATGLLHAGALFAQACSPSDAPQPANGRISGSWWSQYSAWCSRCGGTPFQDNTGGGCRPGPNWGKGNAAGSTGDPGTDAARIAGDMFSRLNPQTPQQMGIAMGASIATGVFTAGLAELMKGPSPEQIRQRQIQEEFARQERARIAREAAEAAERKHRAVMSELKSDGAPTQLALKTDPNAPPVVGGLQLKLSGDAAASLPLTPFSQGIPAAAAIGSSPDLMLKFGDPAAPADSALQQLANVNASVGSNTGFDTAATRIGGLPPAPPTPEGKPVGPPPDLFKDLKPREMTREQLDRAFAPVLEANRAEADAARQEIERLKQAPQRDEQQLKRAEEKLQKANDEKEQLEKKKKEFVDLSLDSLADAGGGGAAAPAALPAVTPATSPAPAAAQ